MLIARIPGFLKRLYKSATWDVPAGGKSIYLTFDDGPTPEVTEWVLKKLKEYKAHATFFCLGKNVEQNPELFKQIQDEGHQVGNHSYSHMKGFSNSLEDYQKDIEQAASFIPSRLFRPPYGRILPNQVKEISKYYKIVMWSVLSVDYNPRISEKQVLKNVISNIRPGSIVVFHDSIKASKNLYYALPGVLEFLEDNGYQTEILSES